MRIEVQTVAAAEQRYPTLGDYWFHHGVHQVRVTRLGDERMEFLIAVHELVELMLCRERGIAEPDIKAFDEANLDSDDPGSLPHAPYHREHMFAERIERLVAQELGVDWEDYESACMVAGR